MIINPIFSPILSYRPGNLFLDVYKDNCELALSVTRRVNSQYYGPILRVVESGSNGEQIIGTVGSDQLLDEVAITDHIGSNDGTTKVIYDQSGKGNDAIKTTIAAQPTIASAGTIITNEGKPAISFDGSDDILATPSINLSNFLLLITVTNWITNGDGFVEHTDNLNNHDDAFYFYGDEGSNVKRGGTQNVTAAGSSWLEGDSYIGALITYSGNHEVWRDGSLVATKAYAMTGDADDAIYIGGRGSSGTFRSEGTLQELYLYSVSSQSDLANMFTDLNSFYSFY